jgi:hypothetical protein
MFKLEKGSNFLKNSKTNQQTKKIANLNQLKKQRKNNEKQRKIGKGALEPRPKSPYPRAQRIPARPRAINRICRIRGSFFDLKHSHCTKHMPVFDEITVPNMVTPRYVFLPTVGVVWFRMSGRRLMAFYAVGS